MNNNFEDIKWRNPMEVFPELSASMKIEDRDRYMKIWGAMAGGFHDIVEDMNKAIQEEKEDENVDIVFASFALMMSFLEKELLKKSESLDAIMGIMYLLDGIVESFDNGYRIAIDPHGDCVKFCLIEESEENDNTLEAK